MGGAHERLRRFWRGNVSSGVGPSGIGKLTFVTGIDIEPDRWLGCAAMGGAIPPTHSFFNRPMKYEMRFWITFLLGNKIQNTPLSQAF